jgi:hypothetical protein
LGAGQALAMQVRSLPVNVVFIFLILALLVLYIEGETRDPHRAPALSLRCE